MKGFEKASDILTEEAREEWSGGGNPLSKQEISQIATRTADEVMERVREPMDIRDLVLGSAMGEGAIPLYGRETRKEPCSCCLIDPAGPNEPENRMCTTKGAIGTLSNREEREWCSEINIVADGRCARAMSIREAARECKEKHPDDTETFFRCYIPAFSQITKGSNPSRETESESGILELEDVGREWDKLTKLQRQPIVEHANLPSSFALRDWEQLPLSKKDAIRMSFPTGGNNPGLIEVTKPKAVVRYKRNYGSERSVFIVEYEYKGERYITGTVVRGTDRSLGWYFGKGAEGLREANRIALLPDEAFSKVEDMPAYSWERKLQAMTEAAPGNPGLIGPIVAATVTMQKLEEERRKKKAQRGW